MNMKPIRLLGSSIQLAKYMSVGFDMLAGVSHGLRKMNFLPGSCRCKASLAAPSQTSLRRLTSQHDGHTYTTDLDVTFDISDLFKYLSDEQAKLSVSKFLQTLRATGLRETDPRLKEMMANLNNVQSDLIDLDTAHKVYIDRETFRDELLIVRTLSTPWVCCAMWVCCATNQLWVGDVISVTFPGHFPWHSFVNSTPYGDWGLNYSQGDRIVPKLLRTCITDNIVLIVKAFRNQFIIPEFLQFTQRINELFWRAKANTQGELASYIPQLARFNPESWGLAICTVDGQRYAIGDAHDPFCMQSIIKPLTYAMVLDELGPDVVHQYVGQEPSGQAFNNISLDSMNRPHNPLINAGAVVTCSLLKQGMNIADKFEYNQQKIRQLSGNEYVSFNNSVFLSERQTADRNFALGYYMKEKQCFPKGTNLHEVLDFYFQLCSVEITCDSGAVIAATLANGGICPITGVKVLEPYCIRDTLSLMLSCGMYDYSGQFAFKVGLPGKSGVSGGIMLVVPNVMGIFMWSPPLDRYGNSCRGIQFCMDLVKTFNFHNFDNLRHTPRKMDPRMQTVDKQGNLVVNLLFAAYNGDVTAIRRCALMEMDMNQADYDGRTALHVAAAEGHTQVVKFLLEKCQCSPFLTDRWGFRAIDDAKRFRHEETATCLESYMSKQSAEETTQPTTDGKDRS